MNLTLFAGSLFLLLPLSSFAAVPGINLPNVIACHKAIATTMPFDGFGDVPVATGQGSLYALATQHNGPAFYLFSADPSPKAFVYSWPAVVSGGVAQAEVQAIVPGASPVYVTVWSAIGTQDSLHLIFLVDQASGASTPAPGGTYLIAQGQDVLSDTKFRGDLLSSLSADLHSLPGLYLDLGATTPSQCISKAALGAILDTCSSLPELSQEVSSVRHELSLISDQTCSPAAP